MKFTQPISETVPPFLFALLLLAYLYHITSGDNPDVWLAPCCGIYVKNSCQKYDTWITWINGRSQMPNGWLGKDSTNCAPQEER